MGPISVAEEGWCERGSSARVYPVGGRDQHAHSLSGPADRVLDIGCGRYGVQLALQQSLVGTKGKVIGTDLDFGNLCAIRQSGMTTPLCVARGETLPFRSGVFDRVVCLEVLEHVMGERELLTELGRVTCPGGQLILSTPHTGLFEWLDVLNVKVFFPRAYRVLNRWFHREGFYAEQVQQQRQADTEGAGDGTTPYHRHYRIEDLEHLLGPTWMIVGLRRTSFVLFPLVGLVAGGLGLLTGRPFPWLWKLAAFEDRIEFGAWSYNIMLTAVRRDGP